MVELVEEAYRETARILAELGARDADVRLEGHGTRSRST